MSTRGRARPPFLVPQFEKDGKPKQRLTAGVPLAKVIMRKLSGIPEIVMVSQPRSEAAERFRRLKTSLINQSEGTPQVIVVTSPGQGEGKSLVATNLALAFAADRRGEVLLIDADLRRPSIGQWLSPAPKLGFSELAQQMAEIDHAVLNLEGTPLKVLPAGEPARDPAELLASDHTKALLASLRDRYKMIVIDTPPIVPFTDADVIGSLSDGLLMLARPGVTQNSMFRRALSLVTSTRVLGTVLNASVFNLADWNSPRAADYDKYYSGKR